MLEYCGCVVSLVGLERSARQAVASATFAGTKHTHWRLHIENIENQRSRCHSYIDILLSATFKVCMRVSALKKIPNCPFNLPCNLAINPHQSFADQKHFLLS